MDLMIKVFQFFDEQNKSISAFSSLIAVGCSIATLVLALIVFLSSRAYEKRAEQLVEELKVALVMIATVKGGDDPAEVGRRIYDDYKNKLLDHARKKGPGNCP